MKNKRLLLLISAFLILSSIAVSAVIFTGTKASGYSYGSSGSGSSGFATSIGGIYGEYGGWIDFFLFALIFGALAKRVFKEEQVSGNSKANIMVIGIAIGLALMLVLYEERTGKRLLIDYWPIAAVVLFSVIAVLLWKFWYNIFKEKGGWWATAIAMIVTLFVFIMLYKELTNGGSTFFGDYFSNPLVNLPLTIPLILLLVLLIWAFKKFSVPHLKNTMDGDGGSGGGSGGGGSPGGGSGGGSGGSGGGSGGSGGVPTTDPAIGLLNKKLILLSNVLDAYNVPMLKIANYFSANPTDAQIIEFLNSYINLGQIRFPNGVKDCNLGAFIKKYIADASVRLREAIDLRIPTGLDAALNNSHRTYLNDAWSNLNDAITLYNASPMLHYRDILHRILAISGVMQPRLTALTATPPVPADVAAAKTGFNNNTWSPLKTIFTHMAKCMTNVNKAMVSLQHEYKARGGRGTGLTRYGRLNALGR